MAHDEAAKADRVVVAVFDGLRPDLVTPELTPNLVRLAARGIWFRQARSVFPSVTRVATSSIATGAPPGVHGIVNNAFHHRQAIPERIFDTGSAEMIRRAEAHHDGRLIAVDTLGDVLARQGRRLAVVHTGSPGSAHFISPRARANGHWTFSIHGAEATQTPEAVAEALDRLGPLPERELPRLNDLRYGGRLMTEHVLPALAPDVALIWFSEPDTTFHYKGLGSAEAKAALQEADRAFGTILDWVEAQPDAERIAVIAASDHGQISTGTIEPLFEAAQGAGFSLSSAKDIGDAALTATGGISGEIRLREGGDRATLARLAAWLMEQPSIGHLFSPARNEVEGQVDGTLSLGLVGAGHERQPDLMFILGSTLTADPYGLPGLGAMTPGDVPLGGGMHGGLNPHELNTVLILAHGEDGGAAAISQEPAGIIDITPTVLGLLGLTPASTMVGRDLARPPGEEARIARHSAGTGNFAQHVDIVEQQGRRFILGGGH
ncbi:alkaline phosphatase family protein [Bosea sp. 124]|uniref:alkaline phosphatase family protein n=1 Tax=Bosea sp. 124 TaxID=2135642 RepID=UPI000D35775A|nr:alkaline phosphatase family protein [Bosea sp. 124]PTM40631.1 putative AlkP superfamily pyrophosphatase or phosphodiesterase [Bosea sp. 124]